MFGRALASEVHVCPFSYDAVASFARFNNIDTPETGPVGSNLAVRVKKFLVAAGLYPETHCIEGGHGASLRVVGMRIMHLNRQVGNNRVQDELKSD